MSNRGLSFRSEIIGIGKALVRLFQPLGIEPEFLGHLDELLRGFRILDGLASRRALLDWSR